MTEDMRMRHISDYWMISTLIFFNIAGNFGNFNLIWLTYRRKELRTKAGMLLAINAVFQSICLVSTFINVTVILSGNRIARNVCYPLVMPFTIASSLQTPMALVIAIDLLLALISPLKYRQQDAFTYIVGICAPGMIYALFIGFYGLIKMDNEMLDFCNVVIGLPPTVSALWVESNMLFNSLVLLVYFGIFLVLRCNYNEMAYREHGRVVRRLAVIVIVFVFSWFMANLGAQILSLLPIPPDILPYFQSNMVFFAGICFSQNFYVCIWRSSDYREAFLNQMSSICHRHSVNVSINGCVKPSCTTVLTRTWAESSRERRRSRPLIFI